jgi:hypothetical protein
MRTRGIHWSSMPGWCAAKKIGGLNEITALYPENTIDNIIKDLKDNWANTSCLVVSVNRQETAVNHWLMKNGFQPGPIIKNWNHWGRETMLCFYQIDRKTYNRPRQTVE